jgi:L-ascorbate metabolism protein UlaG (beta-lactamase superfamily)
VLMSHTHWDHIDRGYLKSIGKHTMVITPTLASGVVKLFGAKNITGLSPWASLEARQVKITATPALHMAPTIGFVIQNEGQSVYFAGDTYYGTFMSEIGRTFKLDAALIPVTTFRIPITMGVYQALKGVTALQPKVVIPIHLGIEPRLPLMRTGQTAEEFARRVSQAGLETKVIILKESEGYSLLPDEELLK